MTSETVEQVRIRKIVTEDDPKALVEDARKLAASLRSKESVKTQIRRLFGTMRQIEMAWPRRVETEEERRAEAEAYRQLLLFKPRLAYQAHRNPDLKPLEVVIQEGIDQADKDRERFQRLVQFFEATVAYYVAGESREQPASVARPKPRKPSARPQDQRGR